MFLFLSIIVNLNAGKSKKEVLADQYREAGKLLEKHRYQNAFLAFMTIPGAQYRALNIARNQPKEYIKLLKKNAGKIPFPLLKAVEGDLWILKGDKKKALKCFREAAAKVTDKPGRF